LLDITKKSVAVVVHSCDRYRLLYEGFEYFFSKYWPLLPEICNYYFLTEELDYTSALFINIKTGKGEWSNRLKNGLEQIPEPYVIYLQEDMWFKKAVDADSLEGIIIETLKNKLQLVKLSSSEVYKTHPGDKLIHGYVLAPLNNAESDFLMSHQASLWNKAFLLQQLLFNEHPWRNERKGTKRLRKLNPLIYQIDLLSENNKAPNNLNLNHPDPGGYMTVSVNAVFNEQILHFLDEFKQDNAAYYTEYRKTLLHNYTHQLTHDGKKKPRKVSSLKKWMKSISLIKR